MWRARGESPASTPGNVSTGVASITALIEAKTIGRILSM
jgi:hypothetical protein